LAGRKPALAWAAATGCGEAAAILPELPAVPAGASGGGGARPRCCRRARGRRQPPRDRAFQLHRIGEFGLAFDRNANIKAKAWLT
jgi:hypothetical protein